MRHGQSHNCEHLVDATAALAHKISGKLPALHTAGDKSAISPEV